MPLAAAPLSTDGVLAMLEARHEASRADADATGAWCRRLCEMIGVSPETTQSVVTAGMLHDIGKIVVPDAILFKAGPLTDAEWVVMKRHAQAGAEILEHLPALAPLAPIVRAHHERWDGRGYPAGLRRDEIPFEARIVAVAGAFHAMISPRPYRRAFEQREAMRILRDGAGTEWDTGVVDAMLTLLDAPRTAAARRELVRGG